MRLLADENFPKPVVEALRAEGHNILRARADGAGATDVVLLDLAEAEARIVLTPDKDFWRIAVQRRSPLEQSGVVLFRVHPATPERRAPLVRAFVAVDTAWAGHISIITVYGIKWSQSTESESPSAGVFSVSQTRDPAPGEVLPPLQVASRMARLVVVTDIRSRSYGPIPRYPPSIRTDKSVR
jgi:predicted nuclease of predicted toxin-antitoxin system